MKEITVSEFYACPKKRAMYGLVTDDNRNLMLLSAVHALCTLLKERSLDWDQLETALRASYKESFFAFPWQKEMQVKDDIARLKRFVKWLGNVEVVEANRRIALDTGNNTLYSRADLVFKTGDRFGAIIIRLGKADKSPGGKSVHTSSKTDLYAMTAKAVLESTYPGITVSLVYLANDTDSPGDIGEFVVSNTRKSNVFSNRFDEYYEEGNWQEEAFLQAIDSVLSTPVEPNCFSCFEKHLCTADTVRSMSRAAAEVEQVEDTGYSVPSFTEAQKRVVDHVDGPMLVCAGPGSGKTATLVGRGIELMNKGIDPEFILAITFTNKAAGELKSRFKGVCNGDAPKCSTIHSLALEILKQNTAFCGEVKVLSGSEKMELLSRLADELSAPLSGFSYGSGAEGRVQFLKTLSTKIDSCLKDRGRFEVENPDFGEDFYNLFEDYRRIVRSRGYITFDQMVPLCNALFKEHPEVLVSRSAIHKYIMVDEFQDIDEEQAKFIYALASHENLVVVGDDDQTIYEFRGGSNRYMLEFKKKFPGAEVVVLGTNFRSGQAIVDASQSLIKGNKHRIDKDLSAARKEGVRPQVIEGQTAKDLDKLVGNLFESGVNLDDIAVLASKNKTLEDLSREVSFPTVLGKALLVENALFRIILDMLSMHFEGMSDSLLVHYLVVSGCDLDTLPEKGTIRERLISAGYLSKDGNTVTDRGDTMSKALFLLKKALSVLKDSPAAWFFTDTVISEYQMEESSVAEAVEEVIAKRHIRDCKALYEAFKYMADFSDDTRLLPDRKGAVLFITSHESKGMEFPVVIMVDDYKEDGSESTNRLYYVAMTRAEDRLVIMKNPGKKTLLDGVGA